jgi:hypothetical protein
VEVVAPSQVMKMNGLENYVAFGLVRQIRRQMNIPAKQVVRYGNKENGMNRRLRGGKLD